MVTTFLFDMGGVLFTNGTKKFIKQMSESYTIPEGRVTNIIDGEIGSQYREGKITRDKFWNQVIQQFHLKESSDVLERQWIDGYELISKTKSIIERLSTKYNVYYLSDNVKERVDALDKKFAFTRLFKGGIFSHEVGVRKPNPQIYEYALQMSNAKPEEAIFIDDKEQMLKPAQKLGIKTVLFTTPEELETTLVLNKLF